MPIHNYPRTQNGVCEACDCADDPVSGSYFGELSRLDCEGEDFIRWTVCNVPEAWHNWVQAGPVNQGGAINEIPGGERYRILPGQSDHLGVPSDSCWGFTTGDAKKKGCYENQVDFADVLDDFGYASTSDVPENGYGSESDPVGACCSDTVEDYDFEPLVPKRYVLKFRDRGLNLSGTFWLSSTGSLSTGRPPSIGGFNSSAGAFPGDYFCFESGFDTDAFIGGNHTPSDFGARDWYNWSPEATIGYVDIEHGIDECFPDVPSEAYPTTARVWWPCNQLHVDHEWEMECELSDFETVSGGWKATYENTSAEWCYGVVTTDSVCTDPTAGGPTGVQASASMETSISKPESWCDYQDSPSPYGSFTVKVPRNITQVTGDGLKVSGTLRVEVTWLRGNDVEFGTGWPCSSGSDFYSPNDPSSPLQNKVDTNVVDAASSAVRLFFDADDITDIPYGLGPTQISVPFAATKSIGPATCQPNSSGDFLCHWPGSCPNDSSSTGGSFQSDYSCFQTRFVIKDYKHRALGTAECQQYFNAVDNVLIAVDHGQNFIRGPIDDSFERTFPANPLNLKTSSLKGYNDANHVPEPGVTSYHYGSWAGQQGFQNDESPELLAEWDANGCDGSSSQLNYTTFKYHGDGRSGPSMPSAGNPYQKWSVQDECRCVRVDGSYRFDYAGGVADSFDSAFGGRAEPRSYWEDNHLILEPHWD